MPCEHYKDALIEAAASGAALQGDLRAHLDVCADCLSTFEQEQALFASIDVGLRVTANAEMPASLLPRVRPRLDESAVTRHRWLQPLIFAAASAALAFAIFLFARPPHSIPNDQAKQTPRVPARETSETNAPHQNSGAARQMVSSNRNISQTRVHSTLFRPAASSRPEILVPPDEREAFARFVFALRGEVALALVMPALPAKDEPTSLEPLKINGLEIKPLEERQTEGSDGAEQRQ